VRGLRNNEPLKESAPALRGCAHPTTRPLISATHPHRLTIRESPLKDTPWPSAGTRGWLVSLLSLRSSLGAQPQRDVGWLHRLPYHSHKFGVKRIEVRLVPEFGREGFQGLPSVVLPPVEATVDERLEATTQWVEHRSYQEGGCNDRKCGLLAAE
jgi:hypothetical protein